MSAVTAKRVEAWSASGELSLVDLADRFLVAERVEDEAWIRSEDLAEAYDAPEPPTALFYRGPDDLFGMPNPGTHHSGRMWFGSECIIQQLRREPRMMSVYDGSHQPRRVPNVRRQARADEIVAAYDAWIHALDLTQRENGLAQATAEARRLSEELKPVREEISRRMARSLDELIAKARVADRCMGGLDEADIDGTGSGIARSIVWDLMALSLASTQSA